MFMHIVTQLSGRVTALYTQALGWLKVRLCKLVNNLRVSFILLSLSVGNLFSRLVKTLSNFKALLVNPTIVVQSIKAALKRVVITNGQSGQPPATTARKIRPRASKQSKKDN
jgi:hypothetical protein